MRYAQDYIDFVCRRQSAFLTKLENPGYVDPVLGTRKFTNVQRIFDRVSQYEIANVIYGMEAQNPIDVLFRIFVFNQFKTIAFWEETKLLIGGCNNFSGQSLINAVESYTGKDKLFTSAYVVPGKGGESKALTIARRCEHFQDRARRIQLAIDGQDIRVVCDELTQIEGIGEFLGSQVCFDFLWHHTCKDWAPLYKLGVGALRGAWKLGLINDYKKCSSITAKRALVEAMNIIQDVYPYATANSVPVPLFLADIQNTFCETDKLFRGLHPELRCGDNSPSRIKGTYEPGLAINYRVPGWMVGSDKQLVPVDLPNAN